MDRYTTYDKNGCFFFDMSDYSGASFDNAEVLNLRFTLLLVESGSGIAEINGNSAPFIAPCVFCINEKEHIVIPYSKDNYLKAIFLHPCVINSQLNFDNCRRLPDDIPMTLQQDRELLRLFLLREHNYFGKFNLGPLSAKKFSSIYNDYHMLITEQNQENWPCRSRSYIM